MLHGQGKNMDTAGLEERLAKLAPQFERSAPFIVGVFSLITVLLAANLYTSPPTFQTDLNDFSPESEASDAHERIHQHFPDEMRPLFVHVTMDDDSNVLSLAALKAMDEDLLHFQNESEKRDGVVHVWTTAPGIMQLALDEEADGVALSSINDWPEFLSLVFTDNETCGLSADDQLLSAATYASSALLHQDLNYNPVCDYLDSETGDGTPTAGRARPPRRRSTRCRRKRPAASPRTPVAGPRATDRRPAIGALRSPGFGSVPAPASGWRRWHRR